MENEKELLVAIEHLKARNISAKHINLAIKALELQYEMKKYCDSHDCIDCRINGICAKLFFLDELQ